MQIQPWLILVGLMPVQVLGVGNGVAQDKPEIHADVVYGHKDGLALTMDVFSPAGEKNGAAIAFMVSGGWVSRWSPPEQMMGLFGPYLEKGYTMVAVRHGSSPRYGIPDAVRDVRRAVRFLKLNAKGYGVDPERIGVMGMSAGGHLSLVLATTGDDGNPGSTDAVLKTSNRVKAVAAIVPPTDLTVCVWEGKEFIPAYKQFPALDMSVEEAAKYSPKLHVTSDDAPALIISGTLDPLVPPRHGEWIAAEYKKQNVEHRLILLEADHGLTGKQAEAFQAMSQWFDKHLAK
jgi:acetyl esterase/lipase